MPACRSCAMRRDDEIKGKAKGMYQNFLIWQAFMQIMPAYCPGQMGWDNKNNKRKRLASQTPIFCVYYTSLE